MKTKAEIVAALTPWAAHYKDIKSAFEGVEAYLSVENPLSNSVWPLFDAYTKVVAQDVGDTLEMLDWFCHENDMGGKVLSARPSRQHLMRPMLTLDDLAQFILESQS